MLISLISIYILVNLIKSHLIQLLTPPRLSSLNFVNTVKHLHSFTYLFNKHLLDISVPETRVGPRDVKILTPHSCKWRRTQKTLYKKKRKQTLTWCVICLNPTMKSEYVLKLKRGIIDIWAFGKSSWVIPVNCCLILFVLQREVFFCGLFGIFFSQY